MTLRKVLTINFILVAIVPLALIGAVAVHIFSRAIETEISNRNQQIAIALSGEIELFLAEPLRVLNLMVDRDDLVKKKRHIPPPVEFMWLLQNRFTVFERIELVDRNGVIRYVAPPGQDLVNSDISGQPFWEDAAITGHLVFSEPFISPQTGMPTIAIALPGKNHVAVGYLSLAALNVITDKITIGKGGRAVIFDRLGHVIAHPQRVFVAERVNLRNLEPVRRAFIGETGTYSYTLQKVEMLGSTAIVRSTGWVVLICQSRVDAFASIFKIQKMLLASVAAAALLALLLALALLKKPLHSIFRLVNAAGKIAGGDYRIEQIPPTYPEIDFLADGLRGMVQEVASRENNLLKTEQRYRNIVEESFDGIFIHDGEKIIFANRSFSEMVGYESDELLGMVFWRVLDPEHRETVIARVHARLRGEMVVQRYESRMLRRDGSSFDVEVSARVVRIEGTDAIQLWVRDITEQKQAEEERNLSERRFRELYNSVSDHIFTQDMDGRFLSANKSMRDIFGMSEDELTQFKASDFMKPEMAPLFETEYLGKLKKHGQYEGVTPYFTRYSKKIYLEYRSFVVQPPQGEPFISGVAHDVTERILSTRILKEKEESMRAVLDASPNPIVAYDTQGNTIFINHSFSDVFGWSLDELVGHRIDFVPNEEKEKTAAIVKEMYRRGDSNPAAMETVRIAKDGRLLNVLVNAALIIGPGGKPAGLVVSLTDITHKKKMEATLLQAQKMEAVGVLAGGIAHDFNNLLMGIMGNVSVALLNAGLNEALRRNIENIESLVSRGASLTRQLLGFARGGKYEVKTHNLNRIIDEEAMLFGNTKKEIMIVKKPAPDLWPVEADQSQIEQVLMNLFVNAGHAMPNGGHLYLSAENVIIDEKFVRPYEIKSGRYVLISVTDTGTGMDEFTQKRIFEPFFTTKEAGKGTGLGLASVYGIVKNHGGFINVYSEKNQGTSFHIYLPASDAGVVDAGNSSSIDRSVVNGEGTILLVDDEEMIMEIGQEMLEAMGYRVITAASGLEAIEKFSSIRDGNGEVDTVDLVIQDMIMPGMGGGEVFDKLKEIDPNVKVLLSSGYSLNGKAREILDRGCQGFIQKPFTMAELSRKIREMIS